eukprot:1181645-Prorocentrum_minimum.AAC.3
MLLLLIDARGSRVCNYPSHLLENSTTLNRHSWLSRVCEVQPLNAAFYFYTTVVACFALGENAGRTNIFSLRFRDWCPLRVYILSISVIGSRYGFILSPPKSSETLSSPTPPSSPDYAYLISPRAFATLPVFMRVQTLVYAQLSLSGVLTALVARAPGPFWTLPIALPLSTVAAIAAGGALAAVRTCPPGGGHPLDDDLSLLVGCYCGAGFLLQDLAKALLYR